MIDVYYPDVVVVSWMYVYVETHQDVYTKYVQFCISIMPQ